MALSVGYRYIQKGNAAPGCVRPRDSRAKAVSRSVRINSTWGMMALWRGFRPGRRTVSLGKKTSSHKSAKYFSALKSCLVLMANHSV